MAPNLPPNAYPHTLPVEQFLPEPSRDSAALVRLVTDPLDPITSEPTIWILNYAHPIATDAKVVRMYHRDDGGVEIYSSDGKMFVRTQISAKCVRFFDEVMNEDTFIAFIQQAESDEDDDDEPEPGENEPDEIQSSPAPTQSQAPAPAAAP